MAQVFNRDQNPPSLKWSQINTENFQVIYPAGFEKEAQRMAATIEGVIGRVSATLKKQPRKISIILQNQGTASNGFVQLAPRRSEFFTTPPQDGDFQDWLNSLAVHELRHVVQLDKLADGYRAPFLEGLALAIFGVTLPPWFYEGDAVITETALTEAGRGRMPGFDMAYRTNLLSGKNYSYSKNYLGSVRDITPGYYALGYFMNSKIRRDHGSAILDSVFRRMRRNPIRPYNFSNSLKTYTGTGTNRLHGSVSAEVKEMWEQQLRQSGAREYSQLTLPVEKYPVNYYLPARLPDGRLMVLKEGRQYLPAIVAIDANGKETRITRIGFQENPHYHYAGSMITWDEFRFDTRFQKRSFNVINTYNLETGEYRQITHRTRYFSPALSPDAKKIAVIEVDYANTVSLRELDARSGEVLASYPNPGNLMLQMPRYNASGSKIVVTGLSAAGKTLVEYDVNDQIAVQLLPFQQQNISRPLYLRNNILYKAHYNGIENLYLFDRSAGKITEVTTTRFGADNPWYDAANDEILFNDYFSTGYRVASVKPGAPGKDAAATTGSALNYSAPLLGQEGGGNALDQVQLKEYPVKPYREYDNLFYFHTVLPLLEENEFTDDVNFGLELLSNNKLNTFDFYTGYEFNYALRRHEYFAGINYKRFYPIFGVEYTNRARLAFRRVVGGSGVTFIPVEWREHYTTMGMTIPVVMNQRNYTYSMNFKVNTELTSRYNIVNNFPNFIDRINFPMAYEYNFSRNSIRAAMDLAPRWGQNIKFTYHHLPFDDRLSGEKFTFQSFFYFPGLFRNHSLQAGFYYQDDEGIYDLDIDIPKVSGYSYLNRLTNQRNSLLLDYRFPIAYPDWELGPLAYIKRLKGGLFTDFANLGKGNPFTPVSYGFELRADMNLLRFYLPNFDVGGRVIFMNKKSTQNPILEFTFSYSY